jgi:tetratricopeptide (TPR) repeat protein
MAACAREAPPSSASPANTEPAAFVGSGKCAACHAAQTQAWQGSQHREAMQPATAATVLGDFENARFTHADITTRFARRDGHYFVVTDGPEGKVAEFEVKYTFGVHPLQQYLVELPRGRLQALPLAWDARPAGAGGQRWFHLYPHERLRAGDPLHWTGYQQTWNFMCADCHSTNLRKHYDETTDTYATRWSEISVGCEACHGAGSKHVAWAEAPQRHAALSATLGLEVALNERRDVAWSRHRATGVPVRSVARTSEREIEVCGRCHSRRSQLTDEVTAADSLHQGFRAALLEPGLYWPDGQMRDEVFNYGSFLQSKMHAAGVTCSDCHEPHSGGLRFDGDATCLQCHEAKLATPAHHFHPAESPGARCTACHMPTSTYMMVDARHDHSFRIPRPDLSVSLGTPNACTACHAERDAEWAARSIRAHYPQPLPGYQRFGPAFAALERGEAGASAQVATIANDAAQPAIVRASALARLGGHAVHIPLTALLKAAHDPSPMVRSAAVRRLAEHPSATLADLLPLLRDETRSVRLEVAGALAGLPADDSDPAVRAALNAATDEYLASERFNADRPEAQVNIGSVLGMRGDLEGAQRAFEAARHRDPGFLPAYINLADVYRASGREQQAEEILRRALPRAASSGSVHYALALSLVRQKRLAEALPLLREAAVREPGNPRFAYVYAIALHDSGKRAAAVEILDEALVTHPDDPELQNARRNFARPDR